MKLNREEVEKIAKLAKLELSEEELGAFPEQVSAILAYVETLQKLDTKDVPEMQHAAGLTNVWREDEVEGCDEDTRKRLIESFPRREGDLLEVDAVFAERTE